MRALSPFVFPVSCSLLPALTPCVLLARRHRKILNCKLLKAFSAVELIVSDLHIVETNQSAAGRREVQPSGKRKQILITCWSTSCPSSITRRGQGSTFN